MRASHLGWGMLSGSRSTHFTPPSFVGGGGWVWVVGVVESGCLHLYFCVIESFLCN